MTFSIFLLSLQFWTGQHGNYIESSKSTHHGPHCLEAKQGSREGVPSWSPWGGHSIVIAHLGKLISGVQFFLWQHRWLRAAMRGNTDPFHSKDWPPPNIRGSVCLSNEGLNREERHKWIKFPAGNFQETWVLVPTVRTECVQTWQFRISNVEDWNRDLK